MIRVWVELPGWVTLIFLCGSGTMKIQEDHKLSSGSGRGTWVPPLPLTHLKITHFRVTLCSAFLPSVQVMFSQACVKNSFHGGRGGGMPCRYPGGWYPSMPCMGGLQAHTQGEAEGSGQKGSPGRHLGGGSPGPQPEGVPSIH